MNAFLLVAIYRWTIFSSFEVPKGKERGGRAVVMSFLVELFEAYN